MTSLSIPLLALPEPYFYITLTAVVLLGLIVGSFLNVVIYRYPLMLKAQWQKECEHVSQQHDPQQDTLNLCVPSSHCTNCQQAIAWWENIPLISFLLLRGRCAFCQARIPSSYFIIELLTTLASVVVFFHFPVFTKMLMALLLTWGLIVQSAIDFREKILPDTITYFLLWLGLLLNSDVLFTSTQDAILASIIGYCLPWLITKIFYWCRKKEGMGHGDFKLFAMLGAWLGITALLNLLLVASLLALAIGSIAILLKRHQFNQPIPFGPFIAIAGWMTLLWGPFLINPLLGQL